MDCGHCDATSGPSEDCPEHGRMPQEVPPLCPKCGGVTKIVERDPDVFERRCKSCGEWYEPPCPECDHDADEHDGMGCREWTPTWPRLVRCPCKLPYATPARLT